jgi:16S rRNA (cytosine967-C5)-methyltransferase
MTDNVRYLVLKALVNVSIDGRSTTEILTSFQALSAQDRGLATELLLGTLHQYFSLRVITRKLLSKPLKRRDDDLVLNLMLGIYQLKETRVPDHAVIHEAVELCLKLDKAWAKGMTNAILRRVQRDETLLDTAKLADWDRYNLPKWLALQLQTDWGDSTQQWLDSMHQRAPLTLRVNQMMTTAKDYLAKLQAAEIPAQQNSLHAEAIDLLSSANISQLPGYADGLFSVQDAAAQWAGHILAPEAGETILDACAAPGGKTTHILELLKNECHLVALDNIPSRLERLEENLDRLNLQAEVRCGDAIETRSWLQEGEQFDRILCDAPCTATGIIRRHPDIGIHRTAKDVIKLNQLQWRILKSLWSCLKPGGTLVYSTCSILKSENEQIILDFVKQNPDASLVPFEAGKYGTQEQGYWQIFPGQDGMDGFFYARLTKLPD